MIRTFLVPNADPASSDLLLIHVVDQESEKPSSGSPGDECTVLQTLKKYLRDSDGAWRLIGVGV